MPRDLPGLYWDEQRQRYFPLSSRPAIAHAKGAAPSGPQPKPQDTASTTMRGRSSTSRAFSRIRSVVRSAEKQNLIQIALTKKVTRTVIPSLLSRGQITTFQTVYHNGRLCSFAGDSMGWFYSSIIDTEDDAANWHTSHGWQPEFNLSSEVSSICISGSRCIATSFGPDCRILHLPLDSVAEDIRVSRIDSRIVHDVWSADLCGSRLVLGANKRAVVIDDVAERAAVRQLMTDSDVFALAQDDKILYTGLRNGALLRFDTRAGSVKRDALFDNVFTQKSNSITNLKLLRDSQLLVSNVNGKISTFDLRFCSCRPLMEFTGNVNSYTIKAPMVVDPSENIVFAAGQDHRVRLWSLRQGGAPLVSDEMSEDQSAFKHQFEHPVRVLQIMEDMDGTCLWIASGTELYKYNLGQRIAT
ncbi:hypothetical protein F5I97DRAFT_1352687 [Phlebopus sp. FC_14]|nr:hypothetical protein F5I97DRAFT_1352687 [Phlebopus sp. FC_14]